MSWSGKLIGGGIGYMFGGPIGAVIGGLIGNKFDQSDKRQQSRPELDEREKLDMMFFTTTFSMLAKFAQADGAVTRSEINVVDNFIKKDLQLDKEARELAIKIFDEAKRNQDSFEDFAEQFYDYFKEQESILVSMLDLLMRVAVADNNLHKQERKYLRKVKQIFNINDSQYKSIKARYTQEENQEENMDKYYKILEVSPEANMSEVKRKYREKVKEFHPDNIINKGLSEEFVDFAEEKFKEIQEAYEMIKKKKAS
ncbi:co-chaperone DjlA [Acetohalobium arabaticum]|uniref:Heat shock protein DnaJ domain protein n=1 Tax=Acetohalobium arabaticum (strain ATCC 49924 / DSM 5501 / Z-7288) TaxID=574087 RepID=D9QQW9_ACEAZ|nr:co-chaperone DjlA [Acetohalobium arabaticum]ADL12910.1 heat shock protein DnaJ domain protein [Acetohalobium arabaticum DSM 5501]